MSSANSDNRSIGLAIFVKTPGYSALKTRLAKRIGHDAAQAFHRLAADAVAAVARAANKPLTGLVPAWAVAEQSALDDPAWAALPRIAQGDGDLGARMQSVTEELCERHDGALLLGADTPQIRVEDLIAAVRALEVHQHVIGPSADGGFWLFGTRRPVPASAWTTTPWSSHDTAERFISALGSQRIARLRSLRDADTADDLPPLLAALDELPDPLPEQRRLADWLRNPSPL